MKNYTILDITKDKKGVIKKVITTTGTFPKEKIAEEIESGIAKAQTKKGIEVISVEGKFLRTVPNDKEKDNLEEL
ncbi:MAG: DUF3892 domain-containing protein [Fusobacteriaceae bacterium]